MTGHHVGIRLSHCFPWLAILFLVGILAGCGAAQGAGTRNLTGSGGPDEDPKASTLNETKGVDALKGIVDQASQGADSDQQSALEQAKAYLDGLLNAHRQRNDADLDGFIAAIQDYEAKAAQLADTLRQQKLDVLAQRFDYIAETRSLYWMQDKEKTNVYVRDAKDGASKLRAAGFAWKGSAFRVWKEDSVNGDREPIYRCPIVRVEGTTRKRSYLMTHDKNCEGKQKADQQKAAILVGFSEKHGTRPLVRYYNKKTPNYLVTVVSGNPGAPPGDWTVLGPTPFGYPASFAPVTGH